VNLSPMRIIFSTSVFVIFTLIITINSCGMLTHHEVTKQALYFYNSTYSATLSDYQSFLQAGSFFPDWGYACGSENGSEVAHWQPFWKAGIELLTRKYSRPYSNEAKGLIAFLFGIIGHGVSDVLWHSLGVDQGFITALKYADFDGKYPSAHSNADFGGDMAISRFTDLSHLEGWSIPFDDVLEIYKSLNQPVTYTQLRVCTAAAYGLQQLEIGLGKYLFPRFAYRSPFLVKNLFNYFHGGISFMATSTSECWKEATIWIENGNVTSSCPHIGNSNQQNNQPSDLFFTNSLCSRIHSNLLRTSNSPTVLNVASTSASWFTSQLCILTHLPSPSQRSLSLLISSSLTALSNHIWSYVSSEKCAEPKKYLESKVKYSLLGSVMVTGDFDKNEVDEVILSAPGYEAHSGRVFVTNGQESGYVEDMDVLQLEGMNVAGAKFGSGCTVVDWNLDGFDDLAVSAPGLTGEYQDGGIFIYFGGSNGLSKKYDVFINGSLTRQPPFVPFPGRDPIIDDRMHYYGESLFGADVDGDGFKDLLVLSPHDTPIVSGAQRGSVQGFLSSNRDLSPSLSYLDADWTLTGTGNYDLFGTSVTFTNNTLLVGVPGYARGDFYTNGAVYGYNFENPRFPQFQFLWTGDDNFGSFGYHLNSNPRGYSLNLT
jgi:glycosylphosphatidylinositol phospholipase D